MTDRALQSVLPVPVRTPLQADVAIFPQLNRDERRLFESSFKADESVFVAMPTGTVVDVGHWMTNGKIWAFATSHELVLMAAGKHPCVQRTEYSHLRGSLYNPVTGELVLAPGKNLKVKHVRVEALDAYKILSQIYANE